MVEHESILKSSTCTRYVQKQNVRSLSRQALIDAIMPASAIFRVELQIRYDSDIQNIKSGFYLNSVSHHDFQASTTLVSCLPSSSLSHSHLHEKTQHIHAETQPNE